MHRYTRSAGKEPGAVFRGGALDEGMRVAISEIELSLEGHSPFSERAADEGLSVVLVSANGSTRVLKSELTTH